MSNTVEDSRGLEWLDVKHEEVDARPTSYDPVAEPMHKYDGTLNLNHNFTVRRYGDQANGQLIYSSKSQKGNYFNLRGQRVSPDIARAAGFDVDADIAEKSREERKAALMAEFEAERQPAASEVIKEAGGYSVVRRGDGRADVLDGDGQAFNPRPLPEADALRFLDKMASFDA